MVAINDSSGGKTLSEVIMDRWSEMKRVRRYYEEGIWTTVLSLVNQRRDDFLQRDAKGRKRGKESWDGSANRALNIWADGMQGFMVSPSEVWARATIRDLWGNDEVRAWLQEYDRAMLAAFERSNFYSVIGEILRDAGSIGTATLYAEEDRVNTSAVFTAIHPGQIWIDENQYGQVDTVYRGFKMTARQAVQKYNKPDDVLSDQLKKDAAEKPLAEYEFLHAVFPNKDRLPGYLGSRGKKFRSIHLELPSKSERPDSGLIAATHVIRDSGYKRIPYAVWRFRKNSDEIYGYSPAAEALVTMEKLNAFSKSRHQAAHLMTEPPYNIPEEQRGSYQILPKGANFYRDPKRIVTPVNLGINPDFGLEETARMTKLLEDTYRVEFFLLLKYAEREMTATEVVERKSEQATLMSPQRGRLVSELLQPEYDLTAEIEDRAGRLPPPPPIVEDYQAEMKSRGRKAKIDVDFIGPLAQSQKILFEAQPIINTVNGIAPMIAIDERIRHKFDFLGMAEDVAESYGCPQKRIRSEAETNELVKQEAEQQAKLQQAEQLGQVAEAVPKLAKGAKDLGLVAGAA